MRSFRPVKGVYPRGEHELRPQARPARGARRDCPCGARRCICLPGDGARPRCGRDHGIDGAELDELQRGQRRPQREHRDRLRRGQPVRELRLRRHRPARRVGSGLRIRQGMALPQVGGQLERVPDQLRSPGLDRRPLRNAVQVPDFRQPADEPLLRRRRGADRHDSERRPDQPDEPDDRELHVQRLG